VETGTTPQEAANLAIGQASPDYAAGTASQVTGDGIPLKKAGRQFKAYWVKQGYTEAQAEERFQALEAARRKGKKRLPADWKPAPSHREPAPSHREPAPSHREPAPSHRDPAPSHHADFVLPEEPAATSYAVELGDEEGEKEYIIPRSEEEAKGMLILGRSGSSTMENYWEHCPDFAFVKMLVHQLAARANIVLEEVESHTLTVCAAPILHHFTRQDGVEQKPSMVMDLFVLIATGYGIYQGKKNA